MTCPHTDPDLTADWLLSAVYAASALFFRILNSIAISGVTSPLQENEQVTFHFVVGNIDGTDVIGSVLFQYVIPRLTSVPERQIIEA